MVHRKMKYLVSGPAMKRVSQSCLLQCSYLQREIHLLSVLAGFSQRNDIISRFFFKVYIVIVSLETEWLDGCVVNILEQ